MFRASRPRKLLLVLPLLGLLLPACEDDKNDSPQPAPAPSGVPVIITTDRITTDTTWPNVEPDTAKYDYVVKSSLEIASGTLTIAPGVRINFDNSNAGLWTSGTGGLTAVGSAAAPIIFESAQRTPGAWSGLNLISRSAANRLNYCRVRYAGSRDYRSNFQPGRYGLILEGAASISNTHVTDTRGSGFFLDFEADPTTFAANAVRACSEHPLVTAFRNLNRVAPTNRLTGAARPAILVYHTGGVDETNLTLRNYGVPVETQETLDLGARNLTVEPGVTLLFGQDQQLRFSTGTLVAQGTATSPITFRGTAANAGSWAGILIGTGTGSRMNHCVVEFGGGSDLYFFSRANLALNDGARFAISNSTIRNSAAWGIYKAPGSVLTATNVTYAQNATGNVGP